MASPKIMIEEERPPSTMYSAFMERSTENLKGAAPAYAASLGRGQQFQWVSFLDLLIPVYLASMLLVESIMSKFVNCFLVPLHWAFNSAPKPATALLHVVTLPLLNIMSIDQLAAQYMSAEVLTLLLQLSLVDPVERYTNVSPWLAHTGRLQYTFHRRRLFVILCWLTFAGVMLFSGAFVSVPVLFFIHRAFPIMYKLALDAVPHAESSRPFESQYGTSVMKTGCTWEELGADYAEVPAVPLTMLPRRRIRRRL